MEAINSEITEFLGEEITEIEIINNTDFIPFKNEILADKIILHMKEKSIIITPLVDTDEIDIEISNQSTRSKSKSTQNILSQFNGLKLNTHGWELIQMDILMYL